MARPDDRPATPTQAGGPFFGIVEVDPDLRPEVPPGQVLVVTREDYRIYGTLEIAELRVKTDYGTLTLPIAELRDISLPAPADESRTIGDIEAASPASGIDDDSAMFPKRRRDHARVVAARFAAYGTLELDRIRLRTKFGELVLGTGDIARMTFGAAAEESPRPPRGPSSGAQARVGSTGDG